MYKCFEKEGARMINIISYIAVIALVVLVFVIAISILIHELPTILHDIENIKEIQDEWKDKKQKGSLIESAKERTCCVVEPVTKEDTLKFYEALKRNGYDVRMLGVEDEK